MNRLPYFLALFVILTALAFACFACGSSSVNTGTATTPQPTATRATQATNTPTPKPQHFKVGQVVNVGNIWQITIPHIRTTQGGQYDLTPAAGETYLVISISAKNISSQEQQFYGSAEFTLRDPAGQSFQASYVSDAKQAPSGKVEAGGPISGDIVYEVPVKVKHFTLSFETNMFAAGQTIWDIDV